MRPGAAAAQDSFIAGTTEASAECSIASTGTRVRARLSGPSACVDGDHWLRYAVIVV